MTIGMFIMGTAFVTALMFSAAWAEGKCFGAKGMGGWMADRWFGQEK